MLWLAGTAGVHERLAGTSTVPEANASVKAVGVVAGMLAVRTISTTWRWHDTAACQVVSPNQAGDSSVLLPMRAQLVGCATVARPAPDR